MRRVASIKLCQKLHNLSGWGCHPVYNDNFETDHIWQTFKDKSNEGHPYLIENRHDTIHEYLDKFPSDLWPAYDLGYLLRELPHFIGDYQLLVMVTYGIMGRPETDTWQAGYFKVGNKVGKHLTDGLDTPEDAACKLAIEMFKQGILTRKML